MAENPETSAEEGEEEQKPAGRKKLVVIAAAALLLLVGGGGAAAYFLGLFGGHESEAAVHPEDVAPPEDAAAADHGENAAGSGAAGEKEGVRQLAFVELPDVLVNLQSPGKRMRYLKLSLALELTDPGAAEELRALTPRVMDSVQLYLRALTVDDVRGAVGMERLKQELTARVNRAVAPLRVDSVLIKEMLVQ